MSDEPEKPPGKRTPATRPPEPISGVGVAPYYGPLGRAGEQPKKPRAWAPIGWLIALLLLLYALSAGPVGWLVNNGYLDARVANVIYAPLGWIYKRSQTMHQVTLWYLKLWGGSP